MIAERKIEVPTGLDLLRQPFPPHQISKLPKESKAQAEARKTDKSLIVWKCEVCGGMHHKNAVHLDYVGHAALTDRLLECDPEWNWEAYAIGPDGLPALDRNGGLWIKLTVCGVTRNGYGDADGKTGGNAVKEAIGDALRNAAMRFGAALDLWHKGDLHADEGEQEGQSQLGAVSPPAPMPDSEWAMLVQLIEATKSDRGKMLAHYGVTDLRCMDQGTYAQAIADLQKKLANMAKADSNAKALAA